MQRSLNIKIFTIVASLLCLLSASIIAFVWLTTNSHIERQVALDLGAAEKVFKQIMNYTDNQLATSAAVLADDFGFKKAVATRDKETIASVLKNHSNRISAQLMILLDIDGSILSSSSKHFEHDKTFIKQTVLNDTLNNGEAISFIQFDDRLYHVVLVTINAPHPIAIALIGFEIEKKFVNNLRDITGLDVTIRLKTIDGTKLISTIKPSEVGDFLYNSNNDITDRTLGFFKDSKYVSKAFELDKHSTNVLIYLSEDINEIFFEFRFLQLKIIAITIVSLFISLFLIAVFSRRLTLPLYLLSKKTSLIANDNYNESITIKANSKEINNLVKSFDDMLENLRLREEKIIYQSKHDLVTGLLNRDSFLDVLANNYDLNKPTYLVAVCLSDIGNISNTFGYEIGDQYLIEMARRSARLSYLAARLTSSQFAFLTDTRTAKDDLEKYHHILSQPIQIQDVKITPNISLSSLNLPEDSPSYLDIYRKISIGLEQASKLTSRTLNYCKEIEEQYTQRLNIVKQLQYALSEDKNQFHMVYQPKIHNKKNITHAEALIRWINPDMGFVAPDMFIPIAEKAGLISKISFMVIEHVIEDIKRWKKVGIDHKVAINLSVHDIDNEQLLPWIMTELAKNNLEPHSLSFEIIESDLMKDPLNACKKLEQYRQAGFDLAIDDFGTGYSSLAYLRHMPITELKIDKCFVMKLFEQKQDQHIVQTIMALAHSLNLQVVAEGVEDEQSLKLLHSYGCEWSQGYYISRPLTSDNYAKWFHSQKRSIQTNS